MPNNSHIGFVYKCIFPFEPPSRRRYPMWVCESVTLWMHRTNTFNSHIHTHMFTNREKDDIRSKKIKAATARKPHHYTILPANPFNNCACEMCLLPRSSFIPSLFAVLNSLNWFFLLCFVLFLYTFRSPLSSFGWIQADAIILVWIGIQCFLFKQNFLPKYLYVSSGPSFSIEIPSSYLFTSELSTVRPNKFKTYKSW